jgi:hypothetical protein
MIETETYPRREDNRLYPGSQAYEGLPAVYAGTFAQPPTGTFAHTPIGHISYLIACQVRSIVILVRTRCVGIGGSQ